MQTFASLLLSAFMSAAAPGATPPAAGPTPAPDGPRFADSDGLPDSLGYDDAYALYEVKLGGEPLLEADQVARWQAELKSGRARAGSLLGSYLSYRALTPSDCSVAREVLQRADELGSDQAPWLLAQLASNLSCGEPDRAQAEKWLRKAVTLDYLSAAQRLIQHHAPGSASEDRAQQYQYARVAAGYWETVYGKTGEPPRADFNAAALLEMEKALSPADLRRAEGEAAKVLAQMLKRHERYTRVAPVEFGRISAGGRAAHSLVGYTLDYRHECEWNLARNCHGAQRLAFAELTNSSAAFLSCKLEIRSRDFVTTAARPLTREVLIGPGATRRLLFGDVSEQPGKQDLTANCAAVADLAANAAAGKCRAKLKGTLNVENFYPQSAMRRGVEGSAVVRFWLPPGSDTVVDAEIASSSGDPSLDEAAIATLRSGQFTKDCDYGLSTLRISFKLGN